LPVGDRPDGAIKQLGGIGGAVERQGDQGAQVWIVRGYITLFTGTPLLVQIFLIYYGPGQFPSLPVGDRPDGAIKQLGGIGGAVERQGDQGAQPRLGDWG
jgi:ABC-type amino acid transport system permease subunit